MVAVVSVAVSLTMLAGLGLLVLMPGGPRWSNGWGGSSPPVVLLCAASNRGVMESILADYRSETGRDVVVQYGPSQALLASLSITGAADLFLPADDSYLDMASEQGLIDATFPLAEMRAVLAVPHGNPLGLLTFDDLLMERVRVAVANPDAAAIGMITKTTLEASGDWERLEAVAKVFPTTVTEVASAVQLGAVDAGIVYDVVLHEYPQLEGVELMELRGLRSQVGVAVVAGARQPREAMRFARYLASADRGLRRYAEYGFTPYVP